MVKDMNSEKAPNPNCFFYGVLSSMLGGEQGKYFGSVL